MHVSYAEGEIDCATAEEVCALLRMRAESHDDVWMSEQPGGYPCLTVLVNGNVACVHFFENDGGDMWQSLGTVDDAVFVTGGGQPDFSPVGATVPLEKAIECARAFFDNPVRPACIEWRAL